MNPENLTERARQLVQKAQTDALAANHQQLLPLHILQALLEDPEGLAPRLIQQSGGNVAMVTEETGRNLAKLPRIEGGNSQLYLAAETARLFSEAGKLVDKAGDKFVSAEMLLLALALSKKDTAGAALARAGVTPQNLNAAIEALRKGRVADSAGAESGYDALKKYARDLTEIARLGKLDRKSVV